MSLYGALGYFTSFFYPLSLDEKDLAGNNRRGVTATTPHHSRAVRYTALKIKMIKERYKNCYLRAIFMPTNVAFALLSSLFKAACVVDVLHWGD